MADLPNLFKKMFLSFFFLISFCPSLLFAYVPDVGPGKCVSLNCEDTYSGPDYSSDYYSGSSSSSGSSDYGGGYSGAAYETMMMNTAVTMMGGFMDSMFNAMAAQQAQQAQIAEQQRVQAEIAWQEQQRLLAIKKEDQIRLRDEYRSKLASSSASIRAGISRIQNMLGGALSAEGSSSSGLNIENLDGTPLGTPDWDGRGGAPGASSSGGLEVMRDDFVDASVVDLRDKTDLVVRPEDVKAMPAASQPVFTAEAATPTIEPSSDPEMAPVFLAPDQSLPPSQGPEYDPEMTQAILPAGADQAPVKGPEFDPEMAKALLPEGADQAPVKGPEYDPEMTKAIMPPEPAQNKGPEFDPDMEKAILPTQGPEYDPDMTQSIMPDNAPKTLSQGPEYDPEMTKVILPPAEKENFSQGPESGAEIVTDPTLPADVLHDAPSSLPSAPERTSSEPKLVFGDIPSDGAVAAQGGGSLPMIDPSAMKGDTRPIEPETIESLRKNREWGERIAQANQQRAEELTADAQMQKVQESVLEDLKDRAHNWRGDQKVLEVVHEKYENQMRTDPARREAIQQAAASWHEAEAVYDARKQAPKPDPSGDEDLSSLLSNLNPGQTWMGPRNPEKPLPNPVAEEQDRYNGVYQMWLEKNRNNPLRHDFSIPELQKILCDLSDEQKKKK